jgi:hypothetical protein
MVVSCCGVRLSRRIVECGMDYERLLTLIDEQVRQHAHTRFHLIPIDQEEAHSGMGGDSTLYPA